LFSGNCGKSHVFKFKSIVDGFVTGLVGGGLGYVYSSE
jgi:hypothetical protein